MDRTSRPQFATAFRNDERGGVAIIFGLIFTVLGMFTALAIDYSRMLAARSALSSAADAAALAVGRALLVSSTTQAQAIAIGEAYFAENAKAVLRAGTPIPAPVIAPDATGKTVTVTASAVVPMTFAALAGLNSVTIPVTATISFDAKDLEVGMALDVTGSMNWPAGNGQTRLEALKDAFESFAATLIPDNQTLGRKVRLGVAPYSASINLGPFAGRASNNLSTDGCVIERTSPTYTDGTPTGGGLFEVRADIASSQLIRYACPPATLIPLSDNKEELIRKVRAFRAAGATGGHFGTQWAWNLVSENYAGFWGGDSAPDPYAKIRGNKPGLVKAVIIMTDGDFNTEFNHGTTSSNQAIKLCDAMKAVDTNFIVLTIKFGPVVTAEERAAEATLKACASPPKPGDSENYVHAKTPADLDAALQSFAAKLSQLRVAG